MIGDIGATEEEIFRVGVTQKWPGNVKEYYKIPDQHPDKANKMGLLPGSDT